MSTPVRVVPACPVKALSQLLDQSPIDEEVIKEVEGILFHTFSFVRTTTRRHPRFVAMQRFVQRVPVLAPIREKMNEFCTTMLHATCMEELEEEADELITNLSNRVYQPLINPIKLLTRENVEGIHQLCDSMLDDIAGIIEYVIPDQILKPECVSAVSRGADATEDAEFNESFRLNLRDCSYEAANSMLELDAPMCVLKSIDPLDDADPAPKLVELYRLIQEIFFLANYQGPADQVRPRKAMRYD